MSHSKIDQVFQNILARIQNGQLAAGERLNSLRDEALAMGVAKNTVVEAYLRLVAQGLVSSRPGAGYYVVRNRPLQRPTPVQPFAGITDGEALLTEQLERRLEIRPGDGRLPPSWLEDSKLRAHLSSMRLLSSEAYNYNSASGYLPLRERLCSALAERGIQAQADQLLMTQGANHAMDLVVRAYVQQGEAVLVDEPGYYPLFSKLNLANARIIGVKRNHDGPCPEDLAHKASASGARLFFTQSLAHNPTGGSITAAVAYGVLRVAEAHDLTIVEDDPFADILPAALPRLASLDQLRRVIYIGSFSKTLAGSFRVGYLAASRARAAELSRLLVATLVSTSSHNERLIFSLIDQGHYLRHLRALRSKISDAMAQTRAALQAAGWAVPMPAGGLYLWLSLPPAMVDAAAVTDAAAHGVFIAPEMAFCVDKSDGGAMRVNVAHGSEPRFIRWLADYAKRTAV